jgi:chromosome segregation ATPase
MKSLGNYFIVAILIASLLLMLASMLVYSSHTNWRDAYQKLEQRRQDELAANEDLKSKYLNQISILESEKEAQEQEVRKLESERVSLVNENGTIQKENDQLRQERRRVEALVASTEENNNRLMDEVTALRASLRENQQARDEAFATTLQATSDLHVASGSLQQQKERNDQLLSQLSTATSALLENGIDPRAKVVPRVRGLISATRRSAGAQLIEITIGADDGVKPGHTIEVFRGDRYLGRAEILKADPDRAVGRVIREYQQGQIQEGDDVATKLRVG